MLLHTPRLRLMHLSLADADFIIDLLNQPSFIQNIGDKGVRNRSDAENYLRDGPLASYAAHGFGLYRVSLAHDDSLIGMCGLLRRPNLEHADIGYALLPQFWSQGYAHEAASAVLEHAARDCHLQELLAITVLDNQPSQRLLEKLGFRFTGLRALYGDTLDSRVYHRQL